MALCVQQPFGSKTGLWNMSDPPTDFSHAGSDVVSASMGFQYPLPSMGMNSPSMIPSLHSLPQDNTQQPSPPATTKALSPPSRPGSVPSKASKLKRSISSPNVRPPVSADAAALALSAEKKRNKLGYHRTSVACGHCRRRKIRCIPAAADPQNRCANCIRLKKECNFFPVDQQPQVEPKRRPSKTQIGAGKGSSSPSPATSASQLPDIQADLPYPHLSMSGGSMKRRRTESFSPENKAATTRSGFEYPGATNWMAPDASPSATPQSAVPQPYWGVNPQDSPLTPAFSPYTPNLNIPPAQNWPVSHAEPGQRDELAWSVPQRSIFDNLQGNPQFGPSSHPPSQPGPDNFAMKGRPLHGGMYPPPISTSMGGHSIPDASSAASIDAPHHAQSAGSMPSHYSQWQQPYPYPKPVSSATEQYDLWSAHSAPAHPSETRNAGPLTFGYGDAGSGSFYPPPPSTPGR